MSAKLFPFTGAVVVVLAVAGPLVVSSVASAQSTPPLAEVARKEAERRKGIKEAQKVITNKDLPESARKPRQAPEPGTPAAGGEQPAVPGEARPAAAAAGAQSSGQKDEAYWRGRITQARENLRRSEAFADALQSRINGLTTDFVNRDDPYQRAKIGEDRQKALDELARVRSDIEQNRKLIDDVEEEARKAGVPPGWLR